MEDKTKLVRIRDVFTENQRCSINKYFKKYKLKFTKKKFIIERCDMRKISKSCNYISLKDIEILLEKVESKYLETKNMNLKESVKTIKKMIVDIESFLNINSFTR